VILNVLFVEIIAFSFMQLLLNLLILLLYSSRAVASCMLPTSASRVVAVGLFFIFSQLAANSDFDSSFFASFNFGFLFCFLLAFLLTFFT